MEILCDHLAETDQALCACGWRGPVCPNVGDAAASWANHVAELMQTGDTRELKAALTVVEKAKAYVTICDDWRGDNSDGATSLRRKAFLELSEAVSREGTNPNKACPWDIDRFDDNHIRINTDERFE